jgi:glucokinase-like ROK family protein
MRSDQNNSNLIISSNDRLDLLDNRSLKDNILRLIWKEHEISRAEIARRFNLSRSTVTEVMKELIKTSFISEIGSGKSSGGRKPILLQFQDDAKFILGIDVGATHISVALTNLRGKLLVWKEERYPVREDPEGTRNLVYQLCDECLNFIENGQNKLLSIGIAVPAPVDPKHPELLPEEIIPSWKGKSRIEEVRERFGVPVYIDNDANLGALAEYYWGAGRGFNDMIFLKMANGVGAGYILNGELYRGAKGIAGEMSHLPIDRRGKLCGCGLRGCLTTFIAAWALKARTHELMKSFPKSPLGKEKEKITIRMIEDCALKGDRLALKVVEEASEHISIAVTSLINMMNPSLIVIGGSLARVEDLLLDPIRDTIERVNLVRSVPAAKIKTSELGTKTIAIGAATLALEETFAKQKFFKNNKMLGHLNK